MCLKILSLQKCGKNLIKLLTVIKNYFFLNINNLITFLTMGFVSRAHEHDSKMLIWNQRR